MLNREQRLKIKAIIIIILFAMLLIFIGLFWVSDVFGVEISARVEDNIIKYMMDEQIGKNLMWQQEPELDDDSKCWMHWSSCDDIKYCVRDAMFCIPK